MSDPLTEVFSLLDLRSARCTRFEAGGEWSFKLPQKPALKFVAVLAGGCWMIQPNADPQWVGQGDTFLLTHSPAYIITSDPSIPSEDGIATFDWDKSDVAQYNGSETVLLAGSFALAPLHARLLLDELPPFLLILASAPVASILRGTLELLDMEIRRNDMGNGVVRHHLADILLIQALRAYTEQIGQKGTSPSWFAALGDQKIGRALNAMHAEVTHPWTVASLAHSVGMSRSAFAANFTNKLGRPPMEYLLHWRMYLAKDILNRGVTITETAERVGYSSASAFGAAFKRVTGRSPRQVLL